ncbi:MAG: hypothetical protein EBS73_15355, partial [Betaproteobacteria bacterium]|nr:hypothetical protein [Betaproteobacteria bacterium]
MAGNDVPAPARFLLTRNAALELRRIHAPEKGRLRQYRSAPFLMIPARQHFVIYDLVPQGIAVLGIQHQVRDIETLIAELTPAFVAEVERLK